MEPDPDHHNPVSRGSDTSLSGAPSRSGSIGARSTGSVSTLTKRRSSENEHPHHHHKPRSESLGPLLLAKSLPRVFKSKANLGVPPGESTQTQRRKIGLLGCILVILGCVLGSGIFAAPEAILRLTENAGVTLLVWFVAGLIALTAALCFVELGCTFPVSGGDYAYLDKCFGDYPAFLFQVSLNLIVSPVCGAILSTTAAKNFIIPNVRRDLICSNGLPVANVQIAIQFVAIMLIMLFVFINCKLPEFIEKIQGSLMIVNITAILLMVICGLVFIGKHGMPHADFNLALKHGVDTKGQVLIMVQSLFQASFSYFGYTYANYITEELENPLRNLPLGVGFSMPIIIGVNLLINFCYIATLTVAQMSKTQTIGDDMFRAILPTHVAPYLAWFATTLIGISVTGGLMSFLLTCSRLPYAGARIGDFPPLFKLVDMKNGNPVPSLIYIGVTSSIFALVGSIEVLISIASYLESAFNCLCIYGLIYVRFKRPNLERPFKLPIIVHMTYAGVATFLFIVPIVAVDKTNYESSIPPVAGMAAIILFGTPLYFLFIRKTQKWPWPLKLDSALMRGCQKLWLVASEDVFEAEQDFDDEEDEKDKLLEVDTGDSKKSPVPSPKLSRGSIVVLNPVKEEFNT